MNSQELVASISAKQEKLKQVGKELKQHFVGLDEVIDRILGNIEAWYCMPQFLTRPTIVCLWGLTGNGKTDLVRRLVKSLDMSDSFVELQMTNKGSSLHYSTTLRGLLDSSNVSPEEPGILLLDEIQRFRSVDQDGKDMHDYNFQDLWMLLSDGSFGGASDTKQEVMQMLLESIYWDDYQQAQQTKSPDDDEEDVAAKKKQAESESRRKFKQTYWSAKSLRRKLRLTESVEEIMRWDSAKKMQVLYERMDDKSIYRAEMYSKLLIFVSGNLDEAYKMSGEVNETDIDADLFHKHSLKISLLTIKGALGLRFKPEQIARFGNTHVIYPSLSRSSYEEIIRRKMGEVLGKIRESCGLNLVPDKTVYDAVYRNGVFPVQGTRPVFSTISSFFESSLPTFTLKCLEQGISEASLYYEKKCLCAKIGGEVVRVKNEGEIDKIKTEKRNDDLICKVAVHEAGHALAYAVLFGYVPTQIAVLTASDDKNGFVGMHDIAPSKSTILRQMMVLLAGRVAEMIVFGTENIGAGAVGDLDRATTLAANYYRRYGMGEKAHKVVAANHPEAGASYCDTAETNQLISKLIDDLRTQTWSLVFDKKALLKDLVDYLTVYEKMEPHQFVQICGNHGVEVQPLDAKKTVQPGYRSMYDEHFEQNEEQ